MRRWNEAKLQTAEARLAKAKKAANSKTLVELLTKLVDAQSKYNAAAKAKDHLAAEALDKEIKGVDEMALLEVS